jgi:hypothetical protein
MCVIQAFSIKQLPENNHLYDKLIIKLAQTLGHFYCIDGYTTKEMYYTYHYL